jgi:hypothetical protein
MNKSTTATPAPKWYVPVVIVALLWNLLGCVMFAFELFAQDAAIESWPEAQQKWARSIPAWIYVIYAAAVTMGVAGSLGLLLRQRGTTVLFAISLVAVVVQMTYTMGIAGGLAVMGPSGLIMPAVVTSIAILLWGFSRFSRKAGWLSR